MLAEEKGTDSLDLAYVFMKQLKWSKIFKSLQLEELRRLSDFLLSSVIHA